MTIKQDRISIEEKYWSCPKHGYTGEDAGICPVCGRKAIACTYDPEVKDVSTAYFNKADAENAIHEFHLFLSRKGKTWRKAIEQSFTLRRHFALLYWGEYDEGNLYLPFDAFVCDSQETADTIMPIFLAMEYVNTYEATACKIKNVSGRYIIEYSGW